ncbi:MAG TPA: hypothetical protein V6C71_25580 [Coleofasciculaceae cyanobacterium]
MSSHNKIFYWSNSIHRLHILSIPPPGDADMARVKTTLLSAKKLKIGSQSVAYS